MRRFCLLMICIICMLTYPTHIMAGAKQTEQTLLKQEETNSKKQHSNREVITVSDGEKTNEIFVNFMDENTNETTAKTFIEKVLPEFKFQIEERMEGTGSYLVSFETIEKAIDAVFILNELDSIYYSCMNMNHEPPNVNIGGTPTPKAPDGFRIKVGSNLMTDSSGKQTPLDPDDENIVPFIDSESGRTLVPLRALAMESYTTNWNEETQEVTLERANELIKLKIGSCNVQAVTFAESEPKAEKIVISETAPVIYRDRTYVPLRLICELWGYNVEWIEETQEIIIRKTDVNLLISAEPF